MIDPKRAFLRHTLATIAYRAAKVERDAPPGFGTFQLGKHARTPVEIVAHLGDLFDWALTMAQGKSDWVQSKPGSWRREVDRFHASLLALDRYLASDVPLGVLEAKQHQLPKLDRPGRRHKWRAHARLHQIDVDPHRLASGARVLTGSAAARRPGACKTPVAAFRCAQARC